jgi:hypothetical protein
VCCGEVESVFLTIDHVQNNGAEQRRRGIYGSGLYKWLKRMKYPKGYQILCWNCNEAKRILGACPHLRRKAWKIAQSGV